MVSRPICFAILFILICCGVRAECIVTQDAMFGGTTCSGTEHSLPDDHSGTAEFPDGGKCTYKGKTYELEPGATIAVGAEGTVTITKGKEFKTDGGTEVKEATRAELKPDGEKIEKAAEVRRDDKVLKAPEDVAVTPGGDLTARRAEEVRVGNLVARGAQDIKIEYDALSVRFAERIEVLDGLLGEVHEFSGTDVQFQVQQARDIVVGCVSLKGVEASDVRISADAVTITPQTGVADFTISDCGFRQSVFQVRSNGARISIPRTTSSSYEVSGGELTCHGPSANDRLETDTTSTVQYGDSCFSCLTLGSGSTYWYSDQDLVKDFGLSRPRDAEAYSLCLRKQHDDPVSDSNDGFVDFVDRKMMLNGKIGYLRLPVRDGQLSSLLMDVIYESRDESNLAELVLDDELDAVKHLHVANPKPVATIPVSVSSGHYSVYEKRETDGTVNRFGRFSDGYVSTAIQHYSSDFGRQSPTVLFADDQLFQIGENDHGSKTQVTAICDGCSGYQNSMSELSDLKRQSDSAWARCGE